MDKICEKNPSNTMALISRAQLDSYEWDMKFVEPIGWVPNKPEQLIPLNKQMTIDIEYLTPVLPDNKHMYFSYSTEYLYIAIQIFDLLEKDVVVKVPNEFHPCIIESRYNKNKPTDLIILISPRIESD